MLVRSNLGQIIECCLSGNVYDLLRFCGPWIAEALDNFTGRVLELSTASDFGSPKNGFFGGYPWRSDQMSNGRNLGGGNLWTVGCLRISTEQ